MIQKTTGLISGLLLLFALGAKGQSVQEVQNKLRTCFQIIDSLNSSNDFEHKDDSVKLMNKYLLYYLKGACENNPATIKANLDLPSSIKVLTSPDNKFRVYCWDVTNGNGGSARSMDVLVQYQSQKKTKATILNDASEMPEDAVSSGFICTALYAINTKDGNCVYLTTEHQVYASDYGKNGITAYTIRNGKLICKYPFFKTATKTLGSIGVKYDLSIPINKNANFPVIKVSEDKQTIYIPVVMKNDAVTNKYVVYKFDGNLFVYDKNSK